MKAFEYEPVFNKTVLKNGVRVVTEHHPYSRSVSAGIYVDLGTRDEPEDLIGAAHFVEHMVFKGTKSRNAYQIVSELEAVGGELNAYTTREYTCFHASTLKEHLPISIDVLIDLMTHASFDKNEFKKEREVIRQEINMSADQLDEYIFDLYFEDSYRGHNLGRPILGTEQTLSQITNTKLKEFYQQRYHGEHMVVAVAGAVDHQLVVDLVERALMRTRSKKVEAHRKKPKVKEFRKVVVRPSEQQHILIGFPAAHFKAKNRFDSYVINSILGGGMTSRLYQKIREELGLAYSVYSYLHSFTDSGLLMVYAGTSEKYIKKVCDFILKEVRTLKDKKVAQKELDFFKTQVKGSLLLGADDVENRMNSLGVNELIFKKYRPVDDVINDVNDVSRESILTYTQKYLNFDQMGMIVLGEVDESKTQEILNSY